MPWRKVTVMSLRQEFVRFALAHGTNMMELCLRFGISRKTGYKWISRFQTEGDVGLVDRPRRPRRSPWKTGPILEKAILEMRDSHTAWGGRKIRRCLQNRGRFDAPAASTITAILKRHNRIDPTESQKHVPWRRFVAEAPNDLWQMDFKGHFPASEGRCHPLTVLDDNSRYSVGLQACKDERTLTVKDHLMRFFRHYGLPRILLVDNGSPWGSGAEHRFTPLIVWVIRQGVKVVHSRPCHPQTLGKDERFHRSLKAEVIQHCQGLCLDECQEQFDSWRQTYNLHRPHEALQMQVPADYYRPSNRPYCENPSPVEYGPDDTVRKVQQGGWISYRGQEYHIPKAFCREFIALRPTETDGHLDVYYRNQRITQIELSNNK